MSMVLLAGENKSLFWGIFGGGRGRNEEGGGDAFSLTDSFLAIAKDM